MRWRHRPRIRPIYQSEISECGLACLAMVATFFGRYTRLGELREKFPSSLRGTTLRDLVAMAEDLGIGAEAWRVPAEELSSVPYPAMIHWEQNHFVLLESLNRRHATIIDPAAGRQQVPLRLFAEKYSGVATTFSKLPNFFASAAPSWKPGVWSKVWFAAVKRHAVLLFACAVALECAALAVPWLVQRLIDRASAGDAGESGRWIAGLAVAAVATVVLHLVRSSRSIDADADATHALSRHVYETVASKPLDFFLRRHVGDTLSRFLSTAELLRVVGPGVMEDCLDALFAVAVAALMFKFGGMVAVLPILGLAVTAAIQAALAPRIRAQRFQEAMSATRQSEILMETVRAMETVAVNGLAHLRRAAWQSALGRTVEARKLSARTQAVVRALGGAVAQLEFIAVLAALAYLLAQSQTSLGAVIAFLAYRSYFNARATNALSRLQDIQNAAVHIERIEELGTARQEAGYVSQGSPVDDSPVGVRLSGLRFSFAGSKEELRYPSVKLEPGQMLCVQGRSGTGKSTLLRLITGGLEPTQGVVEFNGVRAKSLPRTAFRVSAVLQEDFLFSGSLRENITAGRPLTDADVSELLNCVGLGALLQSLPQGLGTLLKESGSTLSGGERQRLLLCRALAAKPQLLVLDEATSHLDEENERAILQMLKSQGISIVFASHSRVVQQFADNVLDLGISVFSEKGHAVYA